MIKNLEEIDCNDELWKECTSQLDKTWGQAAQELRFAFQTKDTSIHSEDVDSLFWDKYPNADQVEVERVFPESKEKGYRYFAVSMIIWDSGITDPK